MKSTVLLAIAIFLASAPAPDSQSISEISGGFLFAPDARALQASETKPGAALKVDGAGDPAGTEAAAGKNRREDTQATRRD